MDWWRTSSVSTPICRSTLPPPHRSRSRRKTECQTSELECWEAAAPSTRVSFLYASEEDVADQNRDGALVDESFAWVAHTAAQFPTLQIFQTRDALLEAGVTPNDGATYDHLLGTKVGGSLFDENGHRHTAADLLTYADPNNIDLFIWASAQHLICASSNAPNGEAEARAAGVLYRDLDGNNHCARLNDNPASEVIIAAGVLGSPQLRMLSGVGPAEEPARLREHQRGGGPSGGRRPDGGQPHQNHAVEVTLIVWQRH